MGSQRVGHDWATSISLFTFMHWRRKWQPTQVFLPGEPQGWGSLVGCHLLGCTESYNWSDLAAAAAVHVTVDGSKLWCCKEQYCIGTWNLKSMNQGKVGVVKQEMARVECRHLGLSKLKWTGMGEFNSDDHYIYNCGQESLRRNRVAIIVNKRVQNAVLGCSIKNDRMICLFPRQTIQYHSNPSLCPSQ